MQGGESRVAAMKPTLIAFLTLCLCLPLAGADKDRPLPKEVKSLKVLAEKGDARAQHYLGMIYSVGIGNIARDLAESAKWFRKAALQGNADAALRLGLMDYLVKGNRRMSRRH